MTSSDLNASEYNAYYATYINKTAGVSLIDGLKENSIKISQYISDLPSEKLDYRYAEGKWTIKEMVQHIIDTERIFSYRALRISRKDVTPLPGYDQDAYVMPSLANDRSIESLVAEYKSVRKSTTSLFESFTDVMLLETGIASNSPLSVRAVGFILIGHENHHCDIIKERYL